ncbi:hypothetical protein [Nitrospira sp. Nam80]
MSKPVSPDLNTATADQLKAPPAIDGAYADKIIKRRLAGRTIWCRRSGATGAYDKIRDQVIAKQK